MSTENAIREVMNYPGLPARRLSALARAGFEVVSQPGAEVSFMVRHQAEDRPGLFVESIMPSTRADGEEALEQDNDEGWLPRADSLGNPWGLSRRRSSRDVEFTETVTASMNGASVIAVSSLSHEPSGSAGLILSQYNSHDQAARFLRSSNPNPTFLYDLAYTFEALLILHPTLNSVGLDTSRRLRTLIQALAYIAGEELKVPILAMHFPAQVPSSALVRDSDGEGWPLASSLAVRVSFALNDRSAEVRLRLVERLVALCHESDAALAVRDPRPGARSGNWRPIVTRSSWMVGPSEEELLCIPATFVGPARVGSTNAIVQYLSRWPDVTLGGCSIVSLNELAFVHLQLCFPSWQIREEIPEELEEDQTAAFSTWWSASQPSDDSLGDRLGRVLAYFAPEGKVGVDRELEATLSSRAGDYHSFFGYPFSIDSSLSKEPGFGLWFSWLTSRGAVDLSAPLVSLVEAFGDTLPRPVVGESPDLVATRLSSDGIPPLFNIEYLLCREVRNGRIRAIGKLSFSETVRRQFEAKFRQGREPTASVASRAIEDAWMARLISRGLSPMELTVSWREMWLGHWAAPV
jgi:hypothetical protein